MYPTRVADELLLDIRMAPEGVAGRLRGAVNQRPERAFGVIKVKPEYVGLVRERDFEIWERRQHAVHAVGRIRARRGGSRIEMRAHVTPRTRLLAAAFFLILAVAVVGFNLRPREAEVSFLTLLVGPAGALVIAIVFLVSARRQGAALRRFVAELFADVAEPRP
ncbi:MAG: hypothetical protein ACRDF0_02190 [Candidatus Limnocylindria bacterium]